MGIAMYKNGTIWDNSQKGISESEHTGGFTMEDAVEFPSPITERSVEKGNYKEEEKNDGGLI